MGYIAEPKGVDFLIKSPPLTDKERQELSEHIRQRKIELKKKSDSKQKSQSTAKPKA
jgi:hypothetical protein